jgi:hypothetical protein
MLANPELRDDSVIGADDVSHLDCGRRDGRLDERPTPSGRPAVVGSYSGSKTREYYVQFIVDNLNRKL